MKLGFSEILVVLIVAMLVIGPDKLPQFTRNAGKALQSFRKALNETTEEVRETLDGAAGDLMEPVQELRSLQKDVTDTVKDTFDPFAKPAAKKQPEKEPDPTEEPAVGNETNEEVSQEMKVESNEATNQEI
jgi:sec-independent protein translocase protein TatB